MKVAALYRTLESRVKRLVQSFDEIVYPESVLKIFRRLGLDELENLTEVVLDGPIDGFMDQKINA